MLILYNINSNNEKIPEDKLNYQTSKIDSKEMVSTLTWKIQARMASHGELNYQRSKIDSNTNNINNEVESTN